MDFSIKLRDVFNFNRDKQTEFGKLFDAGKFRSESALYEFGQIDNEPCLKIHYHGILKADGADTVFLHYGFNDWDPGTIQTVQMNRLENGCFEATIDPQGKQVVNYCFIDPAGNWDNNSGQNWQVIVH